MRFRAVITTFLSFCIKSTMVTSAMRSPTHLIVKIWLHATGTLNPFFLERFFYRDDEIGYCDVDTWYILTSVPSENGAPEGSFDVTLSPSNRIHTNFRCSFINEVRPWKPFMTTFRTTRLFKKDLRKS